MPTAMQYQIFILHFTLPEGKRGTLPTMKKETLREVH
jgi:hypothetical protein